MADAWEIIVTNATDTSDAWAALNSQETGAIVTIANEAATWDVVEKFEKFAIDVRDVAFHAMDTVLFNATIPERTFEIEPEEKPFGV